MSPRLLLLLFALPFPASALTVTTTVDELDPSPGGANISLREAIAYTGFGGTVDFDGSLDGETFTLTLGQIDLNLKFLTIDASALSQGITVSGGGNSRILDIDGSNIVVHNLTFTQGAAAGNGGAIDISGNSTLTLNGCSFVHNTATGNGGAIYCLSSNLVLNTSRVRLNTSGGNGGGIHGTGLPGDSNSITCNSSSLSNNIAPNNGGGFYASGVDSIIFKNSTVNHNRALNRGGGFYTGNNSPLAMENCTVSGNRSTNQGGGISATESTTLDSCTITGNTAGSFGGGASLGSIGGHSINNTIAAGNSAPDAPDLNLVGVGSTITVSGVNLIGSNEGCEGDFPVGSPNGNGDLVGDKASRIDPMLSPLSLFGGTTEVHHPLAGSPVINAGGTTTLTTDQRGLSRSVGAALEIGSVEAGAVLTVTTEIDEDDGGLGAGAGDSLRECLDAATGDGDVIRFASTMSGQTILMTGGEFHVDGKTIFVEASDLASPVTLNPNFASSILKLSNSSALAMHSVDFLSGVATGGSAESGGALECTESTFSLINGRFTNNGAQGTNSSLGGAIIANGATGSTSVHLNSCTFALNSSSGSNLNLGGAIYATNASLLLRGCVFQSNFCLGSGSVANGGAISSVASDIIAEECHFESNSISTFSSGGGGALNLGGMAILDRCSFVNNSAVIEPEGSGPARGGAILSSSFKSTLYALNSTFSGNTAVSTAGAIATSAATSLTHCTITKNDAGNGGGLSITGGNTFLANCIIAENTATSISPDLFESSFGLTVDDGNNLIGDNSSVSATFPAGPLVGTSGSPLDPGLGGLGSHGGLTQTHPLLAGSPARDAAVGSALSIDQRSLPRPVDTAPDIGAYEAGHLLGYPLWATENIPSGLDATFSGNAENDSNGNGLEYACSLSPTLSDGANVLTQSLVDLGGGSYELHFTFPYEPDAPDLFYFLRRNNDLRGNWGNRYRYNSANGNELFHPSGNVTSIVDPTEKTITVIDSNSSTDTGLWRLEVELIP